MHVFNCQEPACKVTYQTFPHSVFDLGDLHLTETLDFLQVLGHCTVDGLR